MNKTLDDLTCEEKGDLRKSFRRDHEIGLEEQGFCLLLGWGTGELGPGLAANLTPIDDNVGMREYKLVKEEFDELYGGKYKEVPLYIHFRNPVFPYGDEE